MMALTNRHAHLNQHLYPRTKITLLQAYTHDTYGIDARAAKNVGQGDIQIYRAPVAHQSTQVATETRNTPQIVYPLNDRDNCSPITIYPTMPQ